MKKYLFGVTAFIVISLVIISCGDPAGPSIIDDPVIPINPTQKTLVVFDNTYGICTAVVYDDYRRRDVDKIAEIPAGQCSDEFEYTPNVSIPFYFAYRISLKDISGFSVDFVPAIGKDQRAVRLDAGTRTVIPIPALDEAVTSQQQVLSSKSYLTIQNNSNYSFQLHRGVSMIRPDNFPDSGVVNSGERAPYTINPGRSSDFSLLVGADYKPFPNSPDRFEAGNFYSYKFTDNVSLDAAIPINLDNIDIKTYTVSFDGNGGSGTVASQSARIASGITLPLGSGLSKGDEIFGGWCADSSGEGIVYSAGTRYTVTGDVTLYAKWYPAGTTLYTVTFDSAEGNEIASQNMVSGAVAIRPADPYRTGYTFGGWYREPGAQSQYDFTTPVSESFTLYATWSANRYTVTFNANGADGAAPAAVTVDYGSGITLPGAGGLSKPDETFHGWNTEDDGAGTGYASGAQYTVTADVTLFAMWSSIPVYEMLLVPGGSFEMGRNLGTGGGSDITPVRTVTLSAFYMGKTEVTQALYKAVMGTRIEEQQALAGTNTTNYGKGDNYPMYYVSWYDALVFCNKLSMEEGLTPVYRISGSTNPSDWGSVPVSNNSTWDTVEIVNNSNGYRLPTEAEWEYAAKGGNGSPGSYTYAGSNNIDEAAWYTVNAGNNTHEVGTKAPNELGIHDMSGNVWEWCHDWYGNYPNAAQTNPTGVSSGSDRVIRGGSWYHPAQYSYSVFRYNNNQYRRNNSQGFRLVRSVICTVSFNINGGTGTSPTTQTIRSDLTITLPNGNEFSRNGYAFSGWNTNADGTGSNYPAGSSYTVTGNVTLYAKWVHVISFDTNGGTGTSPAAQTASPGSTIALPSGTGFSKSGYTFVGWNTNADGTGETYSIDSSYTVTGNVTLYAKWIILYTVTFDLNYADSSLPTTQEVMTGTRATRPSNPVRTGSIFNGWYTEAETVNPYDFNTAVNSAITLYAKWIHIVAFDMNYTGVSGPQSQEVPNGAKAVRPSPDPVRSTGSVFVGWYLGNALIDLYDFDTPVTAGITLYAKWTYNNALVTINVANNTELLSAFSQIQSSTDEFFEILVTSNFSVDPVVLQGANFRGKTVTLRSNGSIREISPNTKGSLLTLSGSLVNFELILKDITLRGRTDNNVSLVLLEGGKCIMESGATITGNTNSGSVNTNYYDSNYTNYSRITSVTAKARGGGVYINGGTLIMSGGAITGNTVSASASGSGDISTSIRVFAYANGGGIYISKGTLTIAGGVISNNTVTASASASTNDIHGDVMAHAFANGGGVCGGISPYDVDSQLGPRNINISGGNISGNTVSSPASASRLGSATETGNGSGIGFDIISQKYGDDIYNQ